ncbi:MAG: hypothetical protein U0Q16_34230 [Bryobacteraceae bacterium]
MHGIQAPFTCGGTLVPEKPVTLCFPDKTRVPVVRAKNPRELAGNGSSLGAMLTGGIWRRAQDAV